MTTDLAATLAAAPDSTPPFSQTRPTGSSIERAAACPISFSLPQITKAGLFAENGSAIHGFIRARLINVPLLEALSFVPEELRDTCRGIDLRDLVGDLAVVRSEVAYAIDTKNRTARELGVNIRRRYEDAAAKQGRPLEPYEIPLTIDLEGRTRDGIETAGEVKTGYLKQPPARLHYQVRSEVLARALVTNADVVRGKLIQIEPGGIAKIDPHVFEPLELEEIADELLEIQDGVVRARKRFHEHEDLTMNPGPWCRHCPAAPVCPANVALVRAIVDRGGEIVRNLAAMTPEQEWEAWLQVAEGIRLLEGIKDAMKNIAAQRYEQGTPIANPDGTEHVRPIESSRTDFSRPMALALLEELGASQDQVNRLWTRHPIAPSYRIVKTRAPVKKRKPTKKELEAARAKELAAKEDGPPLLEAPSWKETTDAIAAEAQAIKDVYPAGGELEARSPGARMREKANER